MRTAYTPIDCSLHDRYLALATQKTQCQISFKDDNDHKLKVTATIEDVYTKAGAEYMQLSSGEVIRLDRVLGVIAL